MNTRLPLTLAALAIACTAVSLSAIGEPPPPVDSAGPLTVRIETQDKLTELDSPCPGAIVVENHGDALMKGTATLQVIAPWTISPQAPIPFEVAPGKTAQFEFTAKAGRGACSAHYTIRAYCEAEAAGKKYIAHPAHFVETQFPAASKKGADVQPIPPAKSARTRAKQVLKGTLRLGQEAHAFSVRRGRRGLLDATVSVTGGKKGLAFEGFKVRVLDANLESEDSPYPLVRIEEEPSRRGYCMRHSFESPEGPFDLLIEIWADEAALNTRLELDNVPAPKPFHVVDIERASVGPWTQGIRRVYAGAGNVIEEPRIFTPGYEGHRLSTTYAGADFAEGTSLVQAVDALPDQLRVVTKTREFTMETPHAQTLTFIPASSVWEAAKVWREIDNRPAAGGVQKLAGRFTFDLWGGKFASSQESLKRAFLYGLTDSIVVWHRWQRWGYDVRLPDIAPPNPDRGTAEQLANIIETCKRHGVLFAPHDNYIDFYPDADGFTYDKVAFDAEGRPQIAWGIGPGGQSYKWLADAITPRLQANLKIMKEDYAPNAYFIDVWGNRVPYDHFDSKGRFYGWRHTRTIWRDSFAWIRDYLGGAPTISESGDDQLVGWLDGGQSNMLRVDATPSKEAGYFVWRVRCKDAERVPWMDAVHHHRFVLQGAGYNSRYKAGLDSKTHGIYSDDYMATEVMAGHAPMVSSPFGRDVVRKYWLLHDFLKGLALCRMESFEFVDDNIHHQHIRWDNGAEVWVNRGATDWTVAGHTLPAYGFFGSIPGTQPTMVAIEKKDGRVVSWSQSPEALFCNPRSVPGKPASAPFGPLTSTGACRVLPDGDALTVVPLPEEPEFSVAIDWESLPWNQAKPSQLEALAEDGTRVSTSFASLEKGTVTVNCAPGTFSYRLSPAP